MQEPDICFKPPNKIRAFLEKRFELDLSRFDEDLICNYYTHCDKYCPRMNFEDNSNGSDSTESPDLIKELYKKTPLKKRPIQPSSFLPDEKMESPKPKAFPVLEGRVSKRKMFKPTKKIIEAYVASTEGFETRKLMETYVPSTAGSETVTKAVCLPAIETLVRTKTSSPVEIDNKAVDVAMAMAVPELKNPTCVDSEMPAKSSKTPKSSKDLPESSCKRTLSEEEEEDYWIALKVHLSSLGLRKMGREKYAADVVIESEQGSSDKEDDTSKASDSSSSMEMAEAVDKKQDKQKIKKTPRKASKNIKEEQKEAATGSASQNMCTLSPALASLVGQKKMKSDEVAKAIFSIFVKRRLVESNGMYINCDDELSGKLFSGKRRLRIADLERYLKNHIIHED